MSKFFILIFLSIPILSFSFEPPIDISTLKPEELFEENKDNVIFKNSSFYLDREFLYYGTTISYSLIFDKDDTSSLFVYFYRPTLKTEEFTEFYSDVLKWYSQKSSIINFVDNFSLNESQPNFYFYLKNNNNKVQNNIVNIYRKESMEHGFRGFGIAVGKESDIDEILEQILVPLNRNGNVIPDIKLLDSFDPKTIDHSCIFLSQELIQNDRTFEITSLETNVGRFLLTPNNKYKLKLNREIDNFSICIVGLQGFYTTLDLFLKMSKDNIIHVDETPYLLSFFFLELKKEDIGLTISISEVN